MHDNHLIIERRLDRFLRDRIRPARYSASAPFTVMAYSAPGEPISFDEAMLAMVDGLFEPFAIGTAYGPPWSTTWFHCVGTVPREWKGSTVEARIDLGFGLAPGFQAEGLVWGPNGPLRALNPLNHAIPLMIAANGGEEFEFLVEAAANPMVMTPLYPTSPLGDPQTLTTAPLYHLKRAELSVFHPEVAALVYDLDVLGDLIQELPLDAPRRPQITRAIERSLDALDLNDIVGTAANARVPLAPALAQPAVPSAHRISAIGHAHIDTAWLWPLRETVRKCARTFSNVLDLMTREPELKFACSQAQQHDWMRERYPNVFEQMVERAAEGRFIPVGGMWVEADTNLPSGESLARQFLHGQRFFHEHYGMICEEVWIPDVFGYPASLPQIFALGGAKWFLTQKLSWNKQNRMPHHTFWWQGIDGTRLFTHFPPIDTYNVSMQPAQLAHAERNYADHGGGSMSMAQFGFGNGGGGPTRDMMERYRRMRDLEGLPRMTIESPADFFAAAQDDYPDAATWVGELYFEMHRGTYTSQAKTKAGNRRSEVLLGDVELWSSLAAALVGDTAVYPQTELDQIWRHVLTLQFHDIIPGSSIAWVHDDAEATYERIEPLLAGMRTDALDALASSVGGDVVLANSAPDARSGVVVVAPGLMPASVPTSGQLLHDGTLAVWADLPAMGLAGLTWSALANAPHGTTVSVQEAAGTIQVSNGIVRVTIDSDGLFSSVYDLRASREVVRAGMRANLLELSGDHPIEYDAWDLDEYYAQNTRELTEVDAIRVLDRGPLVATVEITRSFGASRIVQRVQMLAGSARIDIANDISWYEDEKVLKVAMPVDVHADTAACDIQFGHVHRPMHASTSWDAAKFEVCAHRWVDVSESGYGVALLNDAKYGHDVHRGALRLTLLRAANYPDPGADRGEHHFTYSLLPHDSALATSDVIAQAARLTQPVIAVAGPGTPPAARLSAVTSSNPAVVVTAVKQADDASGDLIVRCYESTGGRASATLSTAFMASVVSVCDFLEREYPEAAQAATLVDRAAADNAGTPGAAINVTLQPFQIVTLRLSA